MEKPLWFSLQKWQCPSNTVEILKTVGDLNRKKIEFLNLG
jgi:hypothetical protein